MIWAMLVFVVASVTGAEAWALTGDAPKKITDYGASIWQQGEGLPNNSLRAILQTSDGYLWVGTKGGLAKFNGTSFRVYSARTPGQLLESEVRALVEGEDGSLYIGTMGGGLSIHKDDKFTTLGKKDGLPDDIVRALCRGRDGSIWIGTDGGVARLRKGKLTTFDEKKGLPSPAVRTLQEDRQGRIWVGTRKGLVIIEGETVIDRSREGALRDREVSAMAMDVEGRLWVATADTSLFRSDGDTFVAMPPTLKPEGRIASMYVDSYGSVWLGTFDGVSRLAGEKLEHYPRFVGSRSKSGYANAIPISDIWAITSDHEGNLWLGSSESGLIQLRKGRFQGITANDGLPSPWVDTLVESANGDLYVGTARGLGKVSGDHVTTIPLGSGDKPCGVRALARGSDEVIWAGSDCGVFSGKGDQFERVPLPSRADERLYAMVRTRDGNLWLGYALSGLLRVTPNGETRWFTVKDGLHSNEIRTAVEATDGTLLVGTLTGGLNQIQGDRVKTLRAAGEGAMAATYDILPTSDGGLWFATRRGLMRQKDGEYVLLPAGQGMPPIEFFYQMLEDSLGHLWLTSNVGIFRVSLADLNALADGQNRKATVAWFTNEDGMPSAACPLTTPNSAIHCQGGQLCFATNGGVAIVDPKHALPSRYAPPLHIEDVVFDRAPIEMKTGMVLGPGRNDIDFTYAGLEYAFPARMNFRYRLKGWDLAWSDPGGRRAAHYTNLSPGEYQFEVVASNSDGVWNPAPATFSFQIAPRFYQTKTFYVFGTIVLLGLVVSVIRIRTRRLKLRTVELEEMVQSRTEAIAQRNRDMRLVLDNANQGFLTVNMDGKLATERPAIVDRWFGSYAPETSFVDFMRGIDPNFAFKFEFGFDQLMSDALTIELAVDQLPTRIQSEGREFACSYTALVKDEKLEGLLVVINDVTADLLHARQEGERKELLALFEAVTDDRAGFLALFDEASEMIAHLSEVELDAQKATLHTLKGNAGMAGLAVVASICDQLEDAIADAGAPLTAAALSPLRERWLELGDALRPFLGEKGRDVVELRHQDLEVLAEEMREAGSQVHLRDRLASWLLEGTERPLHRLGRHADALARRLRKGDLQIEIESHGIRLTAKTWAGFWSELVHVVRNAVDHGLESPHERQQAGKTEPPRVRLSTSITANKLLVEIEDNGRGVDWEAVREAAGRLKLPNQTDEELVSSLFCSGLTTAQELTTLSGRGVGLAAVRRQVEDLGGTISITARKGEGTRVRFEFSLRQIGPRFGIDPGDATSTSSRASPNSGSTRSSPEAPKAPTAPASSSA